MPQKYTNWEESTERAQMQTTSSKAAAEEGGGLWVFPDRDWGDKMPPGCLCGKKKGTFALWEPFQMISCFSR